MDVLHLLITIVLFVIGAYMLYYACEKFKMPPPVFWLCGLIVIVMILVFLFQQLHIRI